MKKVFLYSLIVLSGCQSFHGTNNIEGIEGTYTAYHENEFDKTNDTLILAKANNGRDLFSISRRASYVRTTDGRVLPKKVISEQFTVTYDEEHQILNDIRTGKVFILNTDKHLLVWGNAEFIKK